MIEIPEILDIPEKLIAILTNINKYNYLYCSINNYNNLIH